MTASSKETHSHSALRATLKEVFLYLPVGIGATLWKASEELRQKGHGVVDQELKNADVIGRFGAAVIEAKIRDRLSKIAPRS